MDINKFELRFNNTEFSSSDEGLKVSGYVNKTNQWSQTLGLRKKFVERVLPGAFQRALQRANEIHFYAEHDPAKILASTKNDSLSLREDDKGLYMEATISPTEWGKSYHTLIKDGIITSMSFGMRVVNDSWKKLNDGTYERSISDLDLFEVSAVRNPAYVQSSIASSRSIEVIEDVEIPNEEQRELTLQEQIEMKKSHLKYTQGLADLGDTDSIRQVGVLKKEIREMENTLQSQTVVQNTVQATEKQEERAIMANVNPGALTVPIQLIRGKAKKMNGKNSLVARTKLVVKSEGIYETFLQDAKNRNVNLSKGELTDLEMSEYTGTKVRITTKRVGTAMEMSELLLEKSALEEQEKACEDTLRSDIEDSLNYAMLTGDGNMESLNADTSVSSITPTAGINTISLVDVFELESSLNHSYREGAEFTMHTNTFKKIRTNPEFKDHIEFAIDEVTGKKMYHLIGYPVVINDNANVNRIIFGNLSEGYITVVSEGKKQVTQDLAGKQINKTYYSFDLQKTADTNRALNGTRVYLMDAHVGGKVINKDCFARLDVRAS